MKRLLPILLIAVSLPVCAKTAYISDQLKITMRSGESTTHKVVRMLPSGMQVNVVSQDSKTGYSKIRLSNGTTGYVLTRMLLNERPARERLAEAEEQLQVLRQEPAILQTLQLQSSPANRCCPAPSTLASRSSSAVRRPSRRICSTA